MYDIFALLLAGLIGAGAMEAAISGGAFSRADVDHTGYISPRSFMFMLISAAAYVVIGWWWIAFWAAILGIRMLFFRGRAHVYGEEPDEIRPDYGRFTEIAEKRRGRAPVPEDARLKELIRDGKADEARAHARDMMKAALDFGDPVRAAEYERWLDG